MNALGSIAADWPTAKLMISLTWTGALLLSGAAPIHCDWRLMQFQKRNDCRG